MSTIRLTFSTADGRMESLELGESMAMTDICGFIEAILGIPAEGMVLVANGVQLPASGTLSQTTLSSNDVIMVRTQQEDGGSLIRPDGQVYWDGMGVDEVMSRNSNPTHIVDIIQSRENLMRELNFHNPKLAEHMRKDREIAVKELRMYMMLNATVSTIEKMGSAKKENEMEHRLRVNPMDEEANKFFGEKLQQQGVEQSYMSMMQNFPESLARVLMLYIEVEINGVSLQAFVDSGAQTSVISGKCAERCNISRLIDSRFAGQVVGVGTGSTLGRVHVADIKIEGNYFPISLTVMDDSQGLGDKNMEFLLGLDMLKRHRCSIDLAEGKLYFHGSVGRISTPFLHEKDLPVSKGGTKDFNPNETGAQDE